MPLITDYDSLVAEALSDAHFASARLSAKMPQLVQRASLRINRRLNPQSADLETTLTSTPNGRYLTLPTNYTVPLALWLEAFEPRRKLVYRDAVDLGYTPIASYPERWTIDGVQIGLDRPTLAAYSFTFRYRDTLTLNATTSTTNWMLTNNPDIYLYRLMMEIATFARDPEAYTLYGAQYEEVMREYENNIQSGPDALNTLAVDPGLRGAQSRFNIYEG
jgi:hypothetical protein